MAVSFSVEIEGKDVIATGAIVVIGNEITRFKFDDVIVKILFERTEAKKAAVVGNLVSPKELTLKFKDFDSQLGTTYQTNLAILDGRQLVGNFYVIGLGAKNTEVRQLNYTFTLGGPVNG